MNFDNLYKLVSEIPHFTPSKFPGEGIYVPSDMEFNLANNDIDAVDYKVELWEGVHFEIKRTIVEFLNKLADEGLYLVARTDNIFIFNATTGSTNKWERITFADSDAEIVDNIFKDIFPEELDQSKFKIYFTENQELFLYCSSKYDKCFTRKS